MSRRPRTPAADPHRKANFREEARGIVAKDRYDRKYGHAVDTAGAIARALERAYKQGFADAQDNHVRPTPELSDGGPLDWVLIPPRPRNAFWSCCLFIFGRRGDQLRGGHLERDITERGTIGWRLVVAGFAPDKAMGASSIQPLIRLGLLDADPADPNRLMVSARGRSTWERFLDSGGRYPDDCARV
jgi:hypothetical protein